MRKKHRDNRYSGNLLDAPAHIDERAWENDNILTSVKAAKDAPICHCPTVSTNTYLGGCNPGLRFDDEKKLKAFCRCCLKSLDRRHHKRRQQAWVIGLAETYNTNPGRIDLDSISDLFVTGGSPPANILD